MQPALSSHAVSALDRSACVRTGQHQKEDDCQSDHWHRAGDATAAKPLRARV